MTGVQTCALPICLHEEWKERVKMAQDTISRLEDNIARKTKALRLEDCTSADKLANLKKDKWINLQLNMHVLHDQLITKLWARKFELSHLERAHTSRAMGMHQENRHGFGASHLIHFAPEHSGASGATSRN